MTGTWEDEAAVESTADPLSGYEQEDLGGDIGDSYGGEFDEESSPLDLHAMRARRIALQRQRAARARQWQAPARPVPVSTAVHRTQAAVRDIDLASRVRDDGFGRTLAAQRKRIDRTELAIAASIVERQLGVSFPSLVGNPIVATGLRGAPLLLLKPARYGSGLSGYASNPQTLGLTLMAGLAIVGELKRKSENVAEVRITRSLPVIPLNARVLFRADALDASGRAIPAKRTGIRWQEGDPAVAKVDPTTGEITAVAKGTTFITAIGERGDLFDRVLVEVK